MGMILSVIKWLTGGFLDTIAKAWVVKVQSDAELSKSGVAADRDVLLKQLDNNRESAALAAASRAADRGSLWTCWMMPALAAPILLHMAAVAFDSNVLLGHIPGAWGIPAMPGRYGDDEHMIVLAVIGIDRGAALVRRFAK